MKNKIIVALSGMAIMAVMASMTEKGEVPLSSGAPIGSTNAPGELSCGKAGCHTGDNGTDNINTGKGVLTIKSTQDIENYTPGVTYDITVALEETGVERFGFSLTALDENNNKAGKLIVTEQLRTQIFNGAREYTGREYMTYRMIGTSSYQPNKGLWTFKWQAPDYYVGKITFYAGGISADNDATHYGDLVYTTTMVSGKKYASVNSLADNDFSVAVYPNPAKDYVQVQFEESVAVASLTFGLYNAAGSLVSELPDRNVAAGNKLISFSVKGITPGIYYLNVQGESLSASEKILLIN